MANTNNTQTADTAQDGNTHEMVCIVCPIGCRLKVDVKEKPGSEPEVSVSGNKCPRGEAYAIEEVLAPKRTVTATCRVLGAHHVRRLPVKTSAPLPVEHIDELLSHLYSMKLEAPVSVGDMIVEDVGGTGINVLATRSIQKA